MPLSGSWRLSALLDPSPLQRCWDLRTGWKRLAHLREHRLGWMLMPTCLAPLSSTWRSWHPRRRARARAMAHGRESWCLGLRGCELWRLCFGAGHCVLCSWHGDSGCFIRETGAYFWVASWGRVALACLGLWHLARRGACPMRTRPFLESTGGVS